MSQETLPQNFSLSLNFLVANVTANDTPTDGTLASGQGATGAKVPSGYKFHPNFIYARSNAAITAGSIAVKVTAGGTELTNGPTVTLSSSAQDGAAIARPHLDPIDENVVIGASGTGSGTLDTATKDLDIVVSGVLWPKIS